MATDTALPPHGSITACSKCGAGKEKGTALTVTYHAGVQPWGSGSACRWRPGIGEHLCRKCERCGYGWCEDVVSPDA